MREWLLNLGWTNTVIDIMEVILYAILVLSGIIAIIKQTLKLIGKIVPKFKEIKCFKHKLKFINTFFNWYRNAIKDGKLSDEEIMEINQKLTDIIDADNSEKNVVAGIEHNDTDRSDIQVNDVDL